MASPSSTSSSDLENVPVLHGAPCALLLALVLLVGIEAGVRASGVGTPENFPFARGLQQYEYSAYRLELSGCEEVCFIGTSRGFAAVVVPEVQARCEAALGRSVTVANYSLDGGSAEVANAVVGAMLRQPKRPRVIVYGVSPMTLLWNVNYERTGLFWRAEDAVDALREDPLAATNCLPFVLRNEAGRACHMLRDRSCIRKVLWDRLYPRGHKPPPEFLGYGYADTRPDRSLASHPVTDKHVQAWVEQVYKDGPTWMRPQKKRLFAETLRRCREANVMLILYEMPVSDILHRHYLPGTYETAMAFFTATAAEQSVPLVRVSDLGVTFTDADFEEQSHLNGTGAEKLTRALIDRAVIPTLTKDW